MKIISFCLWGNNPLYTFGAIKNVDLAKIIYPDWKVRFYVDVLVPMSIIIELKKNNAEVIQINEIGNRSFSLNRFLPLFEENLEYVMSRDCDSRLNYREKFATEEWIKSGKTCLIMRDHPFHRFMILAGMWNIKKPYNIVKNISKNVLEQKKDDYLIDFYFLMNYVLPNISKDNILEYDEIFMNKPFPKERSYNDFSYFVGEIYNEKEEFNKEHRKILEDFLKSKK